MTFGAANFTKGWFVPLGGSMTTTAAQRTVATRLRWIDNLRILLTILVILLHLSIAYGAPGDWYYNEIGPVSTASEVLLTLFVAINQAFFMGLFFMISSYFIPASLERKGAGPYLLDRLRRLGIPILFYALLVNPLLAAFLLTRDGGGYWGVLRDRYVELIGVGPTWFLEALLLFTVALLMWRRFSPPSAAVGVASPPDAAIGLVAVGLAVATFVVRIWLPVGWWLEPIHFQIAHFPQYVTLFALGVVAHRRGWFEGLSESQGRLWFRVVLALVAAFPPLFAAGGGLEGDVEPFLGGLHWQQAAFALWEQGMCVAIVVTLLVQFRKRFVGQGTLGRTMSSAAYATYILHAPVITVLAVGLDGIEIELGIKFLLVAPLAVSASFLVGYLAKRLPIARNIL